VEEEGGVEAPQPQGQPAYMQAQKAQQARGTKRTRKPSERIRKQKRVVLDRDGGGSSKEKAISLE